MFVNTRDACRIMDKLIAQSMDKLVAKGVDSPMLRAAVFCLVEESESGDGCNAPDRWARRCAGYRLCDSANILAKYRFWKRVLTEKIDVRPTQMARTLFEAKRIALGTPTTEDLVKFYRECLVERGILKGR